MPAEAGIQSVADHSTFKSLDSRFRGNDGISPITTHCLEGGGNCKKRKLGDDGDYFSSTTLNDFTSMALAPRGFSSDGLPTTITRLP